MRKIYALIAVFICFIFSANTRLAAQTDPALLTTLTNNQFTNDLPVIKDLGLRVDLTQGTTGALAVNMRETTQDLLGTGLLTRVWGYQFPNLPITYPGATIVAMKDQPVQIKWKNKLPGHFLPVDASLHMAHPASLVVPGDPAATVAAIRDWYALGNVPTVTHLHGGHTESASDGLPEAWFTYNFKESGDYYVKDKYWYDNDQESATLWYHDHALGITRLNVYAGLAGFYLLRDNNELGLINSGILPSGDYEIEIVIQDRMFDAAGQLFWPSLPGEGDYDEFLAGTSFPNDVPSVLAEFFGDVILVNGKAWPRLVVEPRKYRFRLLNGSDSRFYVLQVDDQLDSGDDSDFDIMVIGSDDGLLSQPVSVDELVIGPGERYDVVINFSGKANKNITMLNYGPDSPYGGQPIPDADVSDPATTGKIMQFQVTKPLSAVPDATLTGSTPLNTIDPLTPGPVTRQLALFEGTDEYGRLQPMLGTVNGGSMTWSDLLTEQPDLGDTETWEVFNATADAHPIHLHLVKFQIINREEFTPYDNEALEIEDNVSEKPQTQHNGSPSTGGYFHLDPVSPLTGNISEPLSYETGWKDTFIIPPGQVGRLMAKFDRPGRYVWHCHILSHEDHEMMRPFNVGPVLPVVPVPGGKKGAVVENQLEPDQFGEFRLYPNPASDMTTVDFALAEGADVRISIYGMDGRMINSEELGYLNDGVQSIAVPVGHLDNGMYILEVKAGNKLFRENFIVNK